MYVYFLLRVGDESWGDNLSLSVRVVSITDRAVGRVVLVEVHTGLAKLPMAGEVVVLGKWVRTA